MAGLRARRALQARRWLAVSSARPFGTRLLLLNCSVLAPGKGRRAAAKHITRTAPSRARLDGSEVRARLLPRAKPTHLVEVKKMCEMISASRVVGAYREGDCEAVAE